jgi:hypothetical protein
VTVVGSSDDLATAASGALTAGGFKFEIVVEGDNLITFSVKHADKDNVMTLLHDSLGLGATGVNDDG